LEGLAIELDMIWYGAQIQTVPIIFSFMVHQIDIAYRDDEIFNFNPAEGPVKFWATLDQIASEWSAIMVHKRISNGQNFSTAQS
jgi:hypothetical protein